jgi:CRISPR-associated endonuclease Csy4
MADRFYLAVKFVPERADYALLAGRCIAVLHGFMSTNAHLKNKVGVTFPEWSEHSIGSIIAFVAESQNDLIGLSYQPYLSSMKADGIFKLSEVLPVPENLPEVRFVRNQTIGKIFVANKKRRIQRTIVRREMRGDESLPVAEEDREFDLFQRIPIESKKSGQEFILHIQRQLVNEATPEGFNSYGLSTNSDWQGTVPDLVFDLFS